MTVTFSDMMEARVRLMNDGKAAKLLKLDADSFESLKEDTRTIKTEEHDGEETLGQIDAVDVVESDENLFVTEDGTEYDIHES